MASHGGSEGRGAGLGGGDSPPRPPVFRTEAERWEWKKSEGARKLREYEAARREARVRRVKVEIVEFDTDGA
jgi:hypothetical protein